MIHSLGTVGSGAVLLLIAGCGGGGTTAGSSSAAGSSAVPSANQGAAACAAWDTVSGEAMRLLDVTLLSKTAGGPPPTTAELDALKAANSQTLADATSAAASDPAYAALPALITAADAVSLATYFDPGYTTDAGQARVKAAMAKVGAVDAWCQKQGTTG